MTDLHSLFNQYRVRKLEAKDVTKVSIIVAQNLSEDEPLSVHLNLTPSDMLEYSERLCSRAAEENVNHNGISIVCENITTGRIEGAQLFKDVALVSKESTIITHPSKNNNKNLEILYNVLGKIHEKAYSLPTIRNANVGQCIECAILCKYKNSPNGLGTMMSRFAQDLFFRQGYRILMAVCTNPKSVSISNHFGIVSIHTIHPHQLMPNSKELKNYNQPAHIVIGKLHPYCKTGLQSRPNHQQYCDSLQSKL